METGTDYNHSIEYTYNEKNQLTRVSENLNGATHFTVYTYDEDNRTATKVADTVTQRMTYDNLGRFSSIYLWEGPITKAYTYGAANTQVTGITLTGSSYSKNLTYTYDDNGNILSVSDGTNTTTYVYDSANQLLRENNQEAGKTWTWDYDRGGNITSWKEYAYTTGELASTYEDVKNYIYRDTEWGDLLTARAGKAYRYDGIGNPLSDGVWTYTWKHGRQLASMTDGTTTWDYTYDVNGLRTSATNGTAVYKYYYSDGKLVQKNHNSLTLYFIYDVTGAPIMMKMNAQIYYYVTNLQGDVIAMLDSSGNTVASYTYDAWGRVLTATGSMAIINPLRYRGYVYDHETNLYYLQSRYYNPELGRFLNADAYTSTGGLLGSNMFAYCGNNPVDNIDSTGTEPYELFDSIDEAALDFAMCYNSESIESKQEYGSSIFMYIKRVTYSTTKYHTFNLFGFSVSIPYRVTNVVFLAKYYYNEPAVGRSGHSVTPNFVGIGTLVSTVHTHANYDPDYRNDEFSKEWGDIFFANLFRMDIYVATPIGKLLKYTYADRNNSVGGISVISTKIPWDSNHPDR